MSSLSYRRRVHLKDSIGGQGDEETLFSTLSERPASPDRAFRRAKRSSVASSQDEAHSIGVWKKSQDSEDPAHGGSVLSQPFSEASSRARKGLEKRWAITTADLDNASALSAPASRAASSRSGLEADARSTLSFTLSSPGSLRRSASRLSEPLAGVCSALSPSLGHQAELALETSTLGSRADSRLSLSRRGLDELDDVSSVALSDSRSLYSQHSLGRSFSMPPRPRTSASAEKQLEDPDIRPVSHRSYLDPDLEAAINEVLSYKPIKFKRSSLDPDSEEEDKRSVRSARSAVWPESSEQPCNSLRRSASALDCSRSRSRPRSRKDSSSSSSEDDSEEEARKKKSARRHAKKAKKKSKKKKPPSDSETSSDTTSSSYHSSSSVKKGPKKKTPASEGEGDAEKSHKHLKKEEKQRKKQVDSLMMKYLYRPESD